MRARRAWGAAVAAMVMIGSATLVAPPAGADGTTPVAITCTGIPVLGSITGTANVEATDSVDPVLVGGTVVNTLRVPIPVGDVPITVTITEVKITVPIPSGVTVGGVTFTATSFANKAWTVQGTNLVITLTGSVPLGGSAPIPTVPDIAVTTTVAGPPRTVAWKVPSTITAKGSSILGNFTANCTPDNKDLVLLSTVVKNPNQAPTATDQLLPVAFQTPTAVTLGGTDPDGDPLTYAVADAPDHGTLTGTAPNLTYTPATGYSGPDSFTFTASDGVLSDTGTVSITVAESPTTVPSAPTMGAVSVAEGEAHVAWTPPASNGGSPITGYVLTPSKGGVPQTPIELAPGTTSTTVGGLANGSAYSFRVAAKNLVGTGPASAASATVTPQWWLPWSSGTVAVNEIFTWLTGKAPTAAERTAWLSQLGGGTKLPGDLVAALRDGADATANVDPTARLYAAYLVRVPDKGGLDFWLNRRRNGWKLAKISANFAASNEFKTRYGSLTNRKFVEQIYANVLGRPGEPSGVAYWTKKLDQRSMDRGAVMVNFSESNEYKTAQADNVDAAITYIHLLGRTPTLAERDAFAAQLAGGATLADLVRGLIHQSTFADRAG